MSSCLDCSKLDTALSLSKFVVYHTYLQNLTSLSLLKPSISSDCCLEVVRLNSDTSYKPPSSSLLALLLACQSLGIRLGYVIHISQSRVSTYIAIVCDQGDIGRSLVQDYLNHLTPPIPYSPLSCSEIEKLFCCDTITSTSFYPPSSDVLKPFQFFPPLASSTNYTILYIAEPMSICEYVDFQEQFQRLYTCLHPFRDISYICTDTDQKTSTEGCSHTHTTQVTSSLSENESDTHNNNCTEASNTGLSLNTKHSDKVSSTANTGSSINKLDGKTTVNGSTTNQSSQNTCNQGTSDSDTCTHTLASTTNYRQFNLQVESLLLKCTDLSDFVKVAIRPPAFKFAAYFLSCCSTMSIFEASTYTNALTPDLPSYYPKSINTWFATMPCFSGIYDRLVCLTHPTFSCPNYGQPVSAALPWGAYSIDQLFYK